MITLEKSLRHMAWSNQMIFSELSKMPEDIYGLRAADGEWPVGKILNHFIGAAEWFRFLLNGTPWSDQPKIKSREVLLQMQRYLAELDKTIIDEFFKEDAEIDFKDDDGNMQKTTRAMVLTQAVMHTAEHKGQLSTILKVHGHLLDLDKYDLWSFESSMGQK